MAVLELGINLGMKSLVEIKYYSSSDNVLNTNIRAKFLTGLEDFITEVFGDKINVISLSNFEIICYFKMVQKPNELVEDKQPLLSYAIIEKGTGHDFVKGHLKKIISHFLNQYDIKDIFSEESKYFKKFEPQIDEILGDLRFKIDDRIRSVFRY
ncbi:MAG: hypothetical protein JSV23_09170 [Promethearchaeota archaeon]|nr:MAG: hypothetical protein JSV23_09170 [Candidatus Lokiarchaeota archaeon]